VRARDARRFESGRSYRAARVTETFPCSDAMSAGSSTRSVESPSAFVRAMATDRPSITSSTGWSGTPVVPVVPVDSRVPLTRTVSPDTCSPETASVVAVGSTVTDRERSTPASARSSSGTVAVSARSPSSTLAGTLPVNAYVPSEPVRVLPSLTFPRRTTTGTPSAPMSSALRRPVTSIRPNALHNVDGEGRSAALRPISPVICGISLSRSIVIR
jgi:hypothetical protein